MDEEEYRKKYVNLKILKSIQDYLKCEGNSSAALYPIEIPEDLLFQAARMQGAESADRLIHEVFELGLTLWSEKLYHDVFGSEENLEAFIELVKERSKEWKCIVVLRKMISSVYPSGWGLHPLPASLL